MQVYGGSDIVTDPIWLSVARMFLGEKEIAGASSNPVILRWAADIGSPGWFDNDDKAWCAVFVNRLMRACQLPMAGTGFELLRAKSFETWGVPLVEPSPGAVLVFARPEGAHVGLYLGERADAYRVLGGNQGNAVSEVWIAKARLTAIRWPAGIPMPAETGPVMLIADGAAMSRNEA